MVIDELLPLLGLAGFGYALPLLDLLGGNPEFLVSHYLTGASLVAAALALALVPPIVAATSVALVSWRWPRAGHLLWCGWVLLFGTMAAGSLLRSLDLPTEVLQFAFALAGGVLALVAAQRWRAARTGFAFLAGTYDLQVDEPVTALCPNSLCGGSVDWSGLANDAVGVAGQLWLPAGLRERLHSEVQEAADFENVDALGGDSARARQLRVERHIDQLDGGGDRPTLWYAHVVLPHVPWSLGHGGADYRTGGGLTNGPTDLGDWGDDPVLARVGLQRHLLQVGATDRLLGRLMDRLEDEGLWDDALVAVVADHGAAFDPSRPYREPTSATAHEV